MSEAPMDTKLKNKVIRIKRTFSIPLTSVWKAFTEPEEFKKWWGPKDHTCPSCTIDFKVGGKYLCAMKGPDNKEIWSTGKYKEIIPHTRIVYSDSFADKEGNIVPASHYNMPEMDLELLISVEFDDAHGKTNLIVKHEGIANELYDECLKGWQSSLDKIELNIR